MTGLPADSLDVVIANRRTEADGVISLELLPADGGKLPPFDAGAHVDVLVAPDIVRQYSLSNDPTETHRYRLAILLEPQSRGGSAKIHGSFAERQTIRISAPRNNFKLVETAKKSILIAGGIGVTPLLSMAYRLAAIGADFELHYCTRTRGRTAFLDEIANAGFAKKVFVHHDDGTADQLFTAEKFLGRPDSSTHLYICGPKGFMDHVIAGAHKHGWVPDRIHLEYFTADIDIEGDSFTVVAERSGKTFKIPSDQSIANVLEAGGVNVPLSCEQGICGTCLTDILEGQADHRDLFQSDEEKAANKQLTICCSRAKSKILVLDI